MVGVPSARRRDGGASAGRGPARHTTSACASRPVAAPSMARRVSSASSPVTRVESTSTAWARPQVAAESSSLSRAASSTLSKSGGRLKVKVRSRTRSSQRSGPCPQARASDAQRARRDSVDSSPVTLATRVR